MKNRGRRLAVVCMGIALAASCGAGLPGPLTNTGNAAEGMPETYEQKETAVQKGSWGGEGIRLEAGEDGVEIAFSCADARIDKALKTDKNGRFSAEGVFIAQPPGPLRADRPPAEQRALFEGKVSGKVMTLKVTLSEGGTDAGSFTLELGRRVRLMRCK